MIALNVLVCCTDLTEDEARELDLDVVLYSGLWDMYNKNIQAFV